VDGYLLGAAVQMSACLPAAYLRPWQVQYRRKEERKKERKRGREKK
jgi:hypothetical protein